MTRILTAAMAALMIVAVSAQNADLTGTWVLQVETGQGGGSPTFTFKQTGEKLEGTYQGTFGKADVTGTVKGNDATWSFKVDAQGNAMTIEYTGKVDGDSMEGTVKLGDLADGTFTGKRNK